MIDGTSLLEPTVVAALAAAADHFPISELGRADPQTVETLAPAVPEGGVRWVTVPVSGTLEGRLVVLVSLDVASGLFNTKGNAPKLVAALHAAADAAGCRPGEAVTGRGTENVPGLAPDRAVLTMVRLSSGDEHVATLVFAAERATAVEPEASPAAEFPQLSGPAPLPPAHSASATGGPRALSMIRGVEMAVTAELGRSTMTVRQLLELGPGSVIELDRAAGSPIDLLVNGTLIARGEVVVIDEEYGIRVSEVVGPAEEL